MQTDEALYLDARQGSTLAFEKLYLRYEQPLFGFILRHLHMRQDAEDVFHEAMLTIMKAPVVDFPKAGAFAGWLYKVALNLCLNHLRSGKRQRTLMGLFQNEPRCESEDEARSAQSEQIEKIDFGALGFHGDHGGHGDLGGDEAREGPLAKRHVHKLAQPSARALFAG